LLRDISSDAAEKVTSTVRPSQEQLSQIDKPAEENVFHEKPNVSKENLQSLAQSQAEKIRPKVSRSAIRIPLFGILIQMQVEGAASSVSQASTGGQRPTNLSDVNVSAGAESLKESVSQNIPQEAKDRAGELTERTKNYVEEKMPPERRDQILYRLKKMVVEIQGHSECKFQITLFTLGSMPRAQQSHVYLCGYLRHLDQNAIETLLNLAEKYTGHTREASQKGAGAVRGVQKDENLQAAQTNLKVCEHCLPRKIGTC